MTDPQAAPPETDLHLLERFECAVRESCDPAFAPKTQHDARREVVETRTALLRRLARPDALREKVMDAIDESFAEIISANCTVIHGEFHEVIGELKAAVWEGENA
jgi:hypothetical protein